MEGRGALIFCCVLLGGVSDVLTDLLDIPGVKGPEQLASRSKRSYPGQYDCPPAWNIPSRPAIRPCPPGTRLVPNNEGLLHGVPPPPCPPWVDFRGRCHVAGRVYDEIPCQELYGKSRYKQWKENAYRTRLVDRPSPPGPEPVCLPI